MDITIKDIIENILDVLADEETLNSITDKDLCEIERQIIDTESFNDLFIQVVGNYLNNIKK